MAQKDRTLSRRRLGPNHFIRCPQCRRVVPADRYLEKWDGETYLLLCCGSRAHLDTSHGGAENWIGTPEGPA